MKLQTKILLILVPLIFVPLTMIGFVAYKELSATEYNNRIYEMDLVLKRLVDEFNSIKQSSEANVSLFSSSYLLEKYALTADEAERYGLLQRPLIRLFSSYQHAYPIYEEIRFILPDGYESARVVLGDIPNHTEEEINDPYIKQLLTHGDGPLSMLRVNPDTGALSLYTGLPVYLRDNSIDPLRSPQILRGVFSLTVNLDTYKDLMESISLGDKGVIALSDGSGVAYLQNTDDLDTALLQSIPGKLSANISVDSEVISMVLGEAGQTYIRAIELHPGYYLSVALPVNELESAALELRHKIVFITAAAIFVFVSILWFSLNYLIVNPIALLNKAAHKIGHGDLEVKLDLKGSDEISGLANSFSQMARNLADSHSQVRYLAHHDALTGLPNRYMFKEYIARALAYSRRNKKSFALMFIDIDEFKQINDTMGHEAGDRLLEEISDRLNTILRTEDYLQEPVSSDPDRPGEMVARIGGDEFTLLLTDLAHPEQASKVADRILEELSEPFLIGRQKFIVGGSIGITLFPQDAQTSDELVKNADLAMYQAKRSGKNTYRFYTAEMNDTALQRVQLESKIRRALEKKEFILHYQPLVNLQDGQLIGLEALIRWQDGETGQLVSPNYFIPLAEETGLIIPIGEWVLKETCRQITDWTERGVPCVPISVNASGVHLSSRNLPNYVKDLLIETGIPPHLLEIELTETSVMSAADEAAEVLKELHDEGVSIALDDFGTGYSSLSYLRDFAIDKLKIDRSFVKDIESKETQRSIIPAIIAIAHTLKLSVVAEGIETYAELSFLQENQCDIAQGFLLSRPKPAEEIEKLLLQEMPFEEHFRGSISTVL